MRSKRAVTRRHASLLLIVFLAGVACDAAPAPNKTIYAKTSNKELKQKALSNTFAKHEMSRTTA